MGIMDKIVKPQDKTAKPDNVLASVSDQLLPGSAIEWQVDAPTTITTPRTASKEEADTAEIEAANYSVAVSEGLRVLKAEETRLESFTKLVKAHRKYLGKAAQTHFDVAGANRGLAGKLQGLRKAYAQLGYSLEDKVESTDQEIKVIAAKYRRPQS